MIMEFFFWFSLFGSVYSYFLYPIFLLVLPKQKLELSNIDCKEYPVLTLIITAYNEENRIKQKLINTLAIKYPKDKLEILIASDGSTDKTNSIVESFSSAGVTLINVVERKGKENAQLAAIKVARADILVFSDVATIIPEEALLHIASTFTHNSKIGAISSEDRFVTEDGKVAGEGAYVKYEMWLRDLESRVNSLVGLSGSFFACRKSICDNWDINVPSDFNTALNTVTKGYIAISHPKVLGFYSNLKDDNKEYKRKLRTVIRGMAAMIEKPVVLNPFKLGLFSIQIFSHKIMRWLVPWFLLVLLICSLYTYNTGPFHLIVLLSQMSFYALALAGFLFSSLRKNSLIKLPFFFMQVNFALAHAGVQFLLGKRITMWEPSKR